MLRDSISEQSLISNLERDTLISQLELIEDTLRPMASAVSNIKEQSNLSAARTSAMFLTCFIGQFCFT